MWHRLKNKWMYQYQKLLQSQGTPSMVARGFALGMFVEFITLPTLGIAFLLLYPLTIPLRTSFPVALIGFLLGKLIVPFFLFWSYKIGSFLLNIKTVGWDFSFESLFSLSIWRERGLALLSGSTLVGLGVAGVCYVIVYFLLVYHRQKKNNSLIK